MGRWTGTGVWFAVMIVTLLRAASRHALGSHFQRRSPAVPGRGWCAASRGSVSSPGWPTNLRPTTAPTIPASRSTLATEKASPPKVIAHATVSAAPTRSTRHTPCRSGWMRTPRRDRPCWPPRDEEDDRGYRAREAVGRPERGGPDRLEHGAGEQDEPRHQDTTLRPTTQPMSSARSAARRASEALAAAGHREQDGADGADADPHGVRGPGGQAGHRPRRARPC